MCDISGDLKLSFVRGDVSGDPTHDCVNSCMMTHTFRRGLIGIIQCFYTKYQGIPHMIV